MRLRKLNGWHRLFILICVISLVLTGFIAKVRYVKPENIHPFLEQVSPKYAASLKEVKPPPTGIYVNPLFVNPDDLIAQEEYKMPDGEVFYEDKKLVTQQEVELAYKMAKEKANEEYWDKQLTAYFHAFGFYFLLMTSFYGLGWTVAWVRRGFGQEEKFRGH